MRAFALDQFGERGRFIEAPVPEPGDDEILVRVRAASLSTTDMLVMAGYMAPYMEHLFPLIPGFDASGVVEAVGQNVSSFQVGDEVVGYRRAPVMGRGGLADYMVLHEDAVEHKPAALQHHEATVVPHVGLTALAAVDAADLRPGSRVAIIGATGGVGSFAVQLAAAAGAHVIAVSRSDHADYARSLGADEVIDEEALAQSVGSLTESGGLDALIDLAGVPEAVAALTNAVRSGGKVISVILPPDVAALAERGLEGAMVARYAADHRFPELMGMIANGQLRLPKIETFAFDDVEAAIEKQATRHVAGKIAVLMG